jgi:hypothetical protein
MGDLMIVVVAVALGAAGTRGIWRELLEYLLQRPVYIKDSFQKLSNLLVVWLLPLTASFVAMRLRQPRLRRARLILQPGMAAACAV